MLRLRLPIIIAGFTHCTRLRILFPAYESHLMCCTGNCKSRLLHISECTCAPSATSKIHFNSSRSIGVYSNNCIAHCGRCQLRLGIWACLFYDWTNRIRQKRIVKRCVCVARRKLLTDSRKPLVTFGDTKQWAARPCVFGDEKSQRLRDKWNQNDFCSSFISNSAVKDMSLCSFVRNQCKKKMLREREREKKKL